MNRIGEKGVKADNLAGITMMKAKEVPKPEEPPPPPEKEAEEAKTPKKDKKKKGK